MIYKYGMLWYLIMNALGNLLVLYHKRREFDCQIPWEHPYRYNDSKCSKVGVQLYLTFIVKEEIK